MTTTQEQAGALAVREYSKLSEVTGFSSSQINLVRQTVAPGASIVELAWYLYNAKRLNLEPTLDQIYLIRYDRNGPADIVVGINGYRSMAESSGAYAGSDDAEFEYDDVGQPNGAPSKATVTVWKMVQGQRVPFTASARWEEFYPGEGKIGEQYRKRPHNQLAVRAESHALRKGFPYQTGRLDAEPAPQLWIEAAQADETVRHNPARQKALADEYQRVIGSHYDDEPAPKTTRAPGVTEKAAASAVPASSTDAQMIKSVKHPLMQRLATLLEDAAQMDIDPTPFRVTLPAPQVEIETKVQQLGAEIADIRHAIANASVADEETLQPSF